LRSIAAKNLAFLVILNLIQDLTFSLFISAGYNVTVSLLLRYLVI
jgi:hypothetical protein